MREARVEVGLRAIEHPAEIVHAHGELAAVVAEAIVDMRGAERAAVVEAQAAELVFGAEIEGARAEIEIIRTLREDIEIGGRRLAHLRDAVGVAGHNAGGGVGAGDGQCGIEDDLVGEGAGGEAQLAHFIRVVGDGVE